MDHVYRIYLAFVKLLVQESAHVHTGGEMTKEEHELIIGMLATQLALTAQLIDTLVANGTLKAADLTRIWRDSLETGPSKKKFLDQVTELYRAMATAYGVKLELD